MVHIHAENSLRHSDRQETSVVEAKDAPAGDDTKTWAHATPAATEELRRRFVGA